VFNDCFIIEVIVVKRNMNRIVALVSEEGTREVTNKRTRGGKNSELKKD